MRHMGTESTPRGGTHQAEHTHRYQTVVFRSGEACPEAGSKRAMPPDKPGALPPENGFPLNIARVRGQTDPHTQHKQDGAPMQNGTTAWLCAKPDPLEAGDRSGRKSR